MIIISGSSFSGKTEELLQRVRRRIQQKKQGPKALLIVPEQSTLLMERRCLEALGNGVSAWVEVLSFKRLAHHVFTETGGIAGEYADRSTAALVMAAALTSVQDYLTIFSGIGRRQDAVQDLIALMTEMKNYAVSPERLAEYALECQEGTLRMKLLDVAQLYDAYCQRMQQGLKDPRDDLTRLAERLPQCSYLVGREVYFDGFNSFTPQERMVVREIVRQAQECVFTLCMELGEDIQGIFRLQRNTQQELEEMAKELGQAVHHVDLSQQYGREPALSFLCANLFGREPQPWQQPTDCLHLVRCADRFREIEAVANEIARLVRQEGYQYRDFLLIVRSVEEYGEIVDAIFRRHEIPIFLDRKNSILTKPVVMAALSALEILLWGFRYEHVFAYLKTGLTGVCQEEVDQLENYALKWGIRGSKWYEGEFTLDPSQNNDHLSQEQVQHILAQLEDMRRRFVQPLLHLREGMKGRMTVRQRAMAFYQFMAEVKLPQHISARTRDCQESGELAMAQEYQMLWDVLIQVLDQMVMIMGEEQISLSDFYDIFKGTLASHQVGIIPTSLDEVTLAASDRVRAPHTRCVMVLGVNDGSFPLPATDDGIFSDLEKQALQEGGIHLSMTSGERMFAELNSIYAAFSFAKEKLYLFYETGDLAGNEKYPSYLIARVQKMFPQVAVTDGEAYFCQPQTIWLKGKMLDYLAEHWGEGQQVEAVRQWFSAQPDSSAVVRQMGRYANRPALHDAAIIEAAFGTKMESTASRLERYQSCRFSYFMQYGMRARPRARAAFSPVEMGTFLHFVLERFFAHLRSEEKKLEQLTQREGRAIVRQCVDEFLQQERLQWNPQSSRARHLMRRLTETVYAVVERLQQEFSRSQFQPLAFELGLGMGADNVPPLEYHTPEGMTVRVVGKVDRVDGWEQDGRLYIRVIDYKTGSRTFDFSDVYHGLAMQMLIYLFSIWQNGAARFGGEIQPGGVLYLHAYRPYVECRKIEQDDVVQKEREKTYKMSGLVLEEEAVIDAMEHSEDGKRIFVPVKMGKAGLEGNTATVEEFHRLRRYLERCIIRMARQLQQGDISVDPFRKGTRTPCDYCDYRPACGFDRSTGQDHYRNLGKMDAEEFWQKIEEAEQDG